MYQRYQDIDAIKGFAKGIQSGEIELQTVTVAAGRTRSMSQPAR
jgi:hypothetical protein